jgi:starch-binding outer membrane protein, SusD/RagB family
MCGTQGPAWKYSGIDETGSASKKRIAGQFDPNFIYYRYAEVLLMKAEAKAELGDFTTANSLVQQIAERAGLTYTPTNTLAAFRSSLLEERGREFSVEGKRWFDLLRVGKRNHFENKQVLIDIMLSKAGDAKELAIMKTKVLDSMSYYLPIYEDEIKYNRNLVQNPFYSR